jgi:putative flippase GtrA
MIHKPIRKAIDFFYPPFKKLMPISFFRYLACGSLNVGFDWILFTLFYNFVFNKQILDLGFYAFKPYIATLLVTFPLTLLFGFYLSHSVSFEGSYLRRRVQLLRYLIVVGGCLLINYICLKLFIEILHFWPLPAKMVTTVFTTIFSYGTQKNFTFKKDKNQSV